MLLGGQQQPQALLQPPQARRPPLQTPCRRCRAQLGTTDESASVQQTLVLLLVEQQCEVDVNRALLKEEFSGLSVARERRDRVEELLELLQSRRLGKEGASSAPADAVAEGLQIRIKLNQAVEAQRFEEAAGLKARLDQLSQAQGASAPAAPEARRFKLGQIVQHAQWGYRGIVFGWEDSCMSEGDSWREKQGFDQLARGRQQPFYYVLAGEDAVTSSSILPYPTTLVAEELLREADEADRRQFEHALEEALFLGRDSDFHCLPSSQLKKRFGD